MPEIQYLSTFPAILTPSRSIDINVHLPTHVGTNDGITGGIFGSIDFDTNNGGIN